MIVILSPKIFSPTLSARIVIFFKAASPVKTDEKALNNSVATSLLNTTGYFPVLTKPAPS